MKIKGLIMVVAAFLTGCAQNVATSTNEDIAKSYLAKPSDQAYFDASKKAAISACAQEPYRDQIRMISCKVVSDTVIFRIKLRARYEWKEGYDFNRTKNHFRDNVICSDEEWMQNALKSGMAFQIQAVGKDQSELIVLEDCGLKRTDLT